MATVTLGRVVKLFTLVGHSDRGVSALLPGDKPREGATIITTVNIEVAWSLCPWLSVLEIDWARRKLKVIRMI